MHITEQKPFIIYLEYDGEISELEDQHFGLCVSCGNDQYNCEPDASGYICESCGKPKVFGVMYLAFENRFNFSQLWEEDTLECQR